MNYGYGYRYSAKGGLLSAFNPANLANTQFYSAPTIATSINGGSPIAADPVSTLGDIAPSGNDGTQVTAINQPVWNTTHVTYATNDFINIDAVLTDIATSTQGTLSFWLRVANSTPAAVQYLMSFSDTNASTRISIYRHTTGKIGFYSSLAGVVKSNILTDSAVLVNDTWVKIDIEQTGTGVIIYIDNVAVAQTESGATPSFWFNDAPLIDNGLIGCLNFNSGGTTNFLFGDIQQVYISTDVKSSSVKTKLYEHNQP